VIIYGYVNKKTYKLMIRMSSYGLGIIMRGSGNIYERIERESFCSFGSDQNYSTDPASMSDSVRMSVCFFLFEGMQGITEVMITLEHLRCKFQFLELKPVMSAKVLTF